jgi:hypothetical protein
MSSITQSLSDPGTQQPRNRLLWLGFGAVAVAQLVALGMLCSHQVRQAQARDTYHVVQQMAVSDCLQYVLGSTIASCSRRTGLARVSAQDATVAEAMPVSFNYR